MEFLKYTENKDIVSECALDIVNEGWAMGFTDLLVTYIPAIASLPLGVHHAFAASFTAGAISNLITDKLFEKFVKKNPKIESWIKKKADELLKEKKKELKDNSLTLEFDIDSDELDKIYDTKITVLDEFKYKARQTRKIDAIGSKIKNLNILVLYDTNSINKLVLLIKSKNTGEVKAYDIPGPTKQDLENFEEDIKKNNN